MKSYRIIGSGQLIYRPEAREEAQTTGLSKAELL